MKNALLYYLSLPFLYGLSLMPFWLMYRVSDGLYLLLYRLLGYRKGVVMENLRNSFPEKSEAEINRICRDFYRYLCDFMLETLKTLTISPETVKKRVAFKDTSLFEHYYEKNQSIILILGHFGNWEIAGARFSQVPAHKLIVIYRPLKNPYFEKLIVHMRTRLGNRLYTMKNTWNDMKRDRNELTATAFIADQTPSYTNTYWTEFLHQDTPVFTGPEKIAKVFRYPVVYVSIKRPRRGYYEIDTELLFDEPRKTEENEILERYVQRLEQDIQAQPEIWLWTHRRWKHKRPEKEQAPD